MPTDNVVQTTALSYRYANGAQILHDIDLRVERGSIFGFLGPNGSGKTTTLSLLLGLLNNREGDIEIFGQSLRANRVQILKRIGSLIETPSLYGHLNAKENLEVYRAMYGASIAWRDEIVALVGLSDTGRKRAREFSLGMKQRLSIALALLPKPELLVLDEPSNGLDPAGIVELRQLIKRLNKAYGMTILISSHLLAEIEKMVSHVGIIYQGKMLFQGRLSGLDANAGAGGRLLVKTSDNERAYRVLKQYQPDRVGDGIIVSCSSSKDIAAANRMLIENKVDVYLLQPKEDDLEELFLKLTSAQS